MIDEQGRVVSKPLSAGLSEVEKLEAKVVVTRSIRIASDGVCKREYGNAFIAGFDSDGKAVSCFIQRGGVVTERRKYPGQQQVSQETPQQRFTDAQQRAIDEVKKNPLTGSEKHWYNVFKTTLSRPNPNSRASQAWRSIDAANTKNARPNATARGWIATNSTWARYGAWLATR